MIFVKWLLSRIEALKRLLADKHKSTRIRNMKDIPIHQSESLRPVVGNFGTEVIDGTLYISTQIFDAMKQCNPRSAAEAYSIAYSCPSIFTEELKWTTEDARCAVDILREQLRGHVEDSILDYDPSDHPEFALGALPPDPSWIGKTARELVAMNRAASVQEVAEAVQPLAQLAEIRGPVDSTESDPHTNIIDPTGNFIDLLE
jgi:hypothetical protein